MMMWYVVSTILQCGHVVVTEFVPAAGAAAAPLGVGIPLVIGFLWAKKDAPETMGATLGQGFLLGFVPALIGLVLAFSLGHVEAFLLGAGSASSGVTGLIGAAVGKKMAA